MLAVNKKTNSRAAPAKRRGTNFKDNNNHETNTNSATLNSKEIHSAPTTINLRGTEIYFPFKPYKCQENYMSTVLDALHREENALLESPTGTGKTLCLLCSTLAWQRGQAAKLTEYPDGDSSAMAEGTTGGQIDATKLNAVKPQAKVSTIIYASRTHSQLSQVVQELERTRYRPRHAVIGSREQLCIHPKVNTAKATASEINHGCSKLAKDRKCRYRNNLDSFVSPQSEGEGFGIQPVLDIEELRVLGTKRNICPFYFTRGHLPDAEIIFVPYNYLFDKDARTQSLSDVQWQNSVMIFDEAHNLESFASESASFDLSGVDIGGCINEVTRAVGYLQNIPEMTDGSVKLENLLKLKAIFLRFENYIENDLVPAGGSFCGEFIFEIFLKGMRLNHESYPVFLKFVKQVTEMIMEIRGTSANSSGTPKLDHFVGCIKRVFGTKTEKVAFANARFYRVHITPRKGKSNHNDSSNGGGFVGGNSNASGRVLSYWCFSSSPSFHEFEDLGVRSILVTSGTLSPLPSYSLELGISFPHTLENTHVISEEQIAVRVIGKGVTGKVLSSSYNRRDNVEYITELGNTIVSLVRIIPGGVLIFFPSYKSMQTCLERWGGPFSQRQNFGQQANKKNFFQARHTKKSPTNDKYVFPQVASSIISGGSKITLWRRLLSAKAVVIEPKTTGELKEAMKEFDKFISMPKSSGCILMGVCRGKISEGIDFADNRCRAVMVTGLPFAPYLDPKVKLKREYLDSVKASHSIQASKDGGFSPMKPEKTDLPGINNGRGATSGANQSDALSGAEWYSQQAHRAVNQAIGRVIRHRSDYGAILLLDERFGEQRNQIGLSKWVRPRIEVDSKIGSAIGSLAKFYRYASEASEKSKSALGGKKQAIEIKYEDSTAAEISAEDKVTKIALINRNSANAATSNSEGGKLDSDNVQGYVKPESVAKRIDLKDEISHVKNSNNNSLLKQNLNVTSQKKVTELSSLYGISDRISAAYGKKSEDKPTSHSSFQKVVSTSGKKSSTDSHQQQQQREKAKEFFDSAKRCLSKTDFDTMRKLLVAMKSSGDRQDSRSYINSAKDLVKILLKYDSACIYDMKDKDDCHKFDGDTMLGLLYTLLPISLRTRIKTMACKMRYYASHLYRLTKQNLSSEDQEKLKTIFPNLMMENGDNPMNMNDSSTERVYLSKVEKIIKLLTKDCVKNPVALLSSMQQLISSKQRHSVEMIVNEYTTQQRVKSLKASTKLKRGEASIETALFRKTKIQQIAGTRKKSDEEEEEEKSAEEVHAMRLALSAAQDKSKDVSDKFRQALDASRSKFKRRAEAKSITAKDRFPSKTRKIYKTDTSTSMFQSPTNKKSSAINNGSDSIDRCLSEAKKRVFEKATPLHLRIQSRICKSDFVPDDMGCEICQDKSETPCMATCGHVACLTCWTKWLEKSSTCPKCRQNCKVEDLEKILYVPEAKAGSNNKSLTQILQESSDEDELEIIK